MVAAKSISEKFSLLVEIAAVTGARYSQIAGLLVRDLQDEDANPRLMMPSSKRGKGKKRVLRRPVPIPPSLAAKLRKASEGRQLDDPLLVKPGGEPWKRSDHTRLFARAVKQAGIDESAIAPFHIGDLTIYAPRHSNIARQILHGVPIRVVAVMHDTSVAMIKKNYSAFLADHSDAIARSALFEVAAPQLG